MNKITSVPKSTIKFALEENYLSSDANIVGGDYEFPFNPEYTAIQSPQKGIGFRKIELVDTFGYDIMFDIELYEDRTLQASTRISFIVQPTNNLYEVCYIIKQQFESANITYHVNADPTQGIPEQTCKVYLFTEILPQSNRSFNVTFQARYDVINEAGKYENTFSADTIFSRIDVSVDQFENLLKFFNHPKPSIRYIGNKYGVQFSNVWDHLKLYFHADFCHPTQYAFLAERSDFFYEPSKIYQYNPSSSHFKVWVSLDGKTKFLLHHTQFRIELSYILNVQNTLAT